MSEAGTAHRICAYLDGGGSASGVESFRYALYKETGGVPDVKIAESEDSTISAAGAPARWICLRIGWAPVSAGNYWLMIHTGGTAGSLRYYYSGTGNWLGNADAYADGASTSFGTAGAGNGTISAFASYQPSAPIANVFGRSTVASRPLYFSQQGGLGNAYMHVTEFELPVNATMTALYGYLDGLGSTSGSQQVRMVIYGNDVWLASGLKAVSNVITINAGRQPGWVKFDIPPTPLPPGTYHIGIHTGNSPFIVRSYGDPPGSSQENGEDTFEDGPNDNTLNTDFEVSPFGEALSVYATYTTN